MPWWVFAVALAWLVALSALFFVWILTPGLRADMPKLYGHDPGIPVEVPWFGAVGALVASFGGIFFYSRGRWLRRFNYWHVVKPAIGALTGSVSCVLLVVILRTATGSSKVGTDPTTFDASAFVFGYAESAFRQLIKTITDVFLKPGEGTNTAEKVKRTSANSTGGGEEGPQPQAQSGLVKLNVALAPESDAHRSFHPPRPRPTREPPSADLAEGFSPQPAWNLKPEGGRTMPSLTFVNCYLGRSGAWTAADRTRIDHALEAAFTDAALESVIAQYYAPPLGACTMLTSVERAVALGSTVHKDAAERIARRLHSEGVLGEADPANSVINVMLPKGIVLSSEPSSASRSARRGRSRTRVSSAPAAERFDVESAVESTEGLGGYHGSVQLEDGTVIYYAIGVYSDEGNGIVAFDEPWKNVVATFYHELNEARTDPDVDEVNATGNEHLLGWYSQAGGGEIGDLPINACDGDLRRVFGEVALTDGSGSVPIQLMWSNAADGPAARA